MENSLRVFVLEFGNQERKTMVWRFNENKKMQSKNNKINILDLMKTSHSLPKIIEFNVFGISVDIISHINRQCICFSFTYNWNYKRSIEISFLFWRLHVEFNKTKK